VRWTRLPISWFRLVYRHFEDMEEFRLREIQKLERECVSQDIFPEWKGFLAGGEARDNASGKGNTTHSRTW
jgi:hypothetical protein